MSNAGSGRNTGRGRSAGSGSTAGPGLIVPDWPAPAGVRAAFTLRTGGVSAAPYDSLNMGAAIGDSPEAVAENRRRVSEALRLPGEPAWLEQVHGTHVVELGAAAGVGPACTGTGPATMATPVSAAGVGPARTGAGPATMATPVSAAGVGPACTGTGPATVATRASAAGAGPARTGTGLATVATRASAAGGSGVAGDPHGPAAVETRVPVPKGDASVTWGPGQVCAIRVADCMPVLFAARDGSAVGAAHAGWRGLAGGVLEATVERLGVPAMQLIAWMGPAIGQANFEVGDDVRAAFTATDAEAASAFLPNARGRWQCDLYALARRRLAAMGVGGVYGGGGCTFADSTRFFSFRRNARTGRMAALIWIEC
jgi:polyphenol oxidase